MPTACTALTRLPHHTIGKLHFKSVCVLVQCNAVLCTPDDVQEHSIFAGHRGAVVGLHQQWTCFGALLKVPGALLGAGQELILGHQASLWQTAHALPAPKVLLCQLLHLHH